MLIKGIVKSPTVPLLSPTGGGGACNWQVHNTIVYILHTYSFYLGHLLDLSRDGNKEIPFVTVFLEW